MNKQQFRVLRRHPLIAMDAYLMGLNYARAKHFEMELAKDKECCFSMQYLYPLMRELRPKVVVETGVRTGVSSAFILKALKDNGMGELYSIDLPNGSPDDAEMGLPQGTTTGFYVDLFPDLKERWTLILGDAKVELPKLLAGLEIDAFHHDSDHSYEHMTCEFETVWPKLRKGGLLLSDDADRHSAFADFCKKVGVEPVVNGQKGMAKKK